MNTNLDTLINDSAFNELSTLLKKPNIFSILKLESYEIRHSNFLAWLLNPLETHNLKSVFLDFFLSDVLSDDIQQTAGSFKWIKRESINDIDLFIEFDNLVIAIENKFFSEEHSNQLNKYQNFVNKYYPSKQKILVFLTPKGKQTNNNKEYVIYSYDYLLKHLETILSQGKTKLCNRSIIFIEDYIQSVQATIMKTNPENLKAAQLYNEYKDVFDFVMKNTNSDINFVTQQINLLLSDKLDNYVRGSDSWKFSRASTKSISEVLKPVKTTKRAWEYKEPLLFEIACEKENNRLVFMIAVSDFDMKLNNEIHQLLISDSYDCMNSETSWKVYVTKTFDFDFNRYSEKEYIAERFDELFKFAKPIINAVEKSIVENKEKFEKHYT